MKIAVVQFPGSNCDQDCLRALTDGLHVRLNISGTKKLQCPALTPWCCPGDFLMATICAVERSLVFHRS